MSAVNCTTLVCKSESKPGSAVPRFEYLTKSTSCPRSKQFEQTWLAYSVKYCKIRCAVWTKPTKRSSLVCSVGRKLASRGSKDAIATIVSPIRKADLSWVPNCNCRKSATLKSNSIATLQAKSKP